MSRVCLGMSFLYGSLFLAASGLGFMTSCFWGQVNSGAYPSESAGINVIYALGSDRNHITMRQLVTIDMFRKQMFAAQHPRALGNLMSSIAERQPPLAKSCSH